MADCQLSRAHVTARSMQHAAQAQEEADDQTGTFADAQFKAAP